MAKGESSWWPSIPVADWQATRDTLHLYTQVVGKVRLANEPLTNHWWNVAAVRDGPRAHDLADAPPERRGVPDRLRLRATTGSTSLTVAGAARSLDLEAAPGRRLLRRRHGACSTTSASPRRSGRCRSRSPAPSRSPTTATHASYDADAVQPLLAGARRRWSGSSRSSAPRSSASPAPCTCSGARSTSPYTRFSGRAAPPHPGRRAELRAARDVGGVLPRGEQLRLLAGTAGRRRRLLLVRLPGAARLSRRPSSLPPVPAGTTVSASSSCPTSSSAPRRTRMRCCSSSCSRPTRRRQRRRGGIARRSNDRTEHTTMAESYEIDGVPLAPSHP